VEFVAFVMITPVFNMQLACQWHGDINYARKARTSFVRVVLMVPSTLRNNFVWLLVHEQTCAVHA